MRKADLLPTSFLPILRRKSTTLSTLEASDVLSHIALLRELYVPPIHGGFRPSDLAESGSDDDDDEEQEERVRGRNVRARQKARRFSAGLGETMSGLGLELEVDAPPRGFGLRAAAAIREEGEGGDHRLDSESDEAGSGDEDDIEEEDEAAAPQGHLDAFEREWAQKWLEGVIRRSQTFLDQHEAGGPNADADGDGEGEKDQQLRSDGAARVRQMEAVLRDATAVLAIMAGTSAAGSLTRHLLFPVDPALAPAVRASRKTLQANPDLSPETTTFLASLSMSPVSPIAPIRRLDPSVSPGVNSATGSTFFRRRRSTNASSSAYSHSNSETSTSRSPTTSNGIALSPMRSTRVRGRRRDQHRRHRPAIPILLHDAPMGDHLSVGVQTWGSAILLGREMALRPDEFGLFRRRPEQPGGAELSKGKGPRILELGAGTGLLSILCRKLLDLHCIHLAEGPEAAPGPRLPASVEPAEMRSNPGLVVATDFLPSVLANLKICVDLNFPPLAGALARSTTDTRPDEGIHIAKLDWSTFPACMEKRQREKPRRAQVNGREQAGCAELNGGSQAVDMVSEHAAEDVQEEMERFLDAPFDLVLASDCVYDPTHARLLRAVARWVLRPPEPSVKGDTGGTMHILSPLRPTFAPELESIDTDFPVLSFYPPLPLRQDAARVQHDAPIAPELRGEGLGLQRGLKLGTRGDGKRSVRGKRGEGRVDENDGYWWWEVGWG